MWINQVIISCWVRKPWHPLNQKRSLQLVAECVMNMNVKKCHDCGNCHHNFLPLPPCQPHLLSVFVQICRESSYGLSRECFLNSPISHCPAHFLLFCTLSFSVQEEQSPKEASTASSSTVKAQEEPEPEGGKPSKTRQLKKVFKEYGAVGVSFHICISLMSLGMFYLLISR